MSEADMRAFCLAVVAAADAWEMKRPTGEIAIPLAKARQRAVAELARLRSLPGWEGER